MQFCEGTLYDYGGDSIPFNEDDVWPVVPNATLDLYVDHPEVLELAEDVNQKYSQVLRRLQEAFDNGDEGALSMSIGKMFEMKTAILTLMVTPIPPATDPDVGPNAAPTYNYTDSGP